MRRALAVVAVLLLVAAVVAGVVVVTTLRVGPDLPVAELPGPRVRVHPQVVRPGGVVRCEPAEPGTPVRWTVDGAPAGEGPTLTAPATTGAVVTCEAAGQSDRAVVGPGVVGGNVLLVILDDVGADKLDLYDPLLPPPPTPTLDALAAEGVRFATAWSNPVCSPTRAGLLTGLQATNHGLGRVIDESDAAGLRPGFRTLPGLLKQHGYATALIGKWHVTGEPQGVAPIHAFGFDLFQGTWGNLHPPLTRWHWPLVDDRGRVHEETRYSDDVLVHLAQKWIEAQRRPWFVWLALHGAHAPWDPPPPGGDVPSMAPGSPIHDRYDAVLTAADRAIGRLLASLPADVRARTTVIVIGDNGTADQAVRPPYSAERAKGEVYDTGVHVPLIVTGPAVPPSSRGAVATGLVSHVDVLPTVLALAAGDLPDDVADALDGVSFAELLVRPDLPARRDVLYAETFEPRNSWPVWRHMWQRGVRDDRYELVASLDAPDELYDVLADPLEQHDLLAGVPSGEALATADRLRARMQELMASKPDDVLRPGEAPEPPERTRSGRRRR